MYQLTRSPYWAAMASLGAALDACTDDTLLAIAAALPSAADLLRLALTCRAAARRFYFATTSYTGGGGASGGAVPKPGGGAAAAAAAAETWSIAEEAARRWAATCTDQERGWVPRRGRESWLGLMWEVESLRRRGAVLGRSHEYITLSEGGSLATMVVNGDGYYRAAASKAVMRAGRHYVQFTMASGGDMFFGVIRPGWDVEGGQGAQHVLDHCFYDTEFGARYSPVHRFLHWEGMQGAMMLADRIGMLLDLDQGSMTVYKDRGDGDGPERLGVMATGLSGEYSWAVALDDQDCSARIEAAALPAA
jgi:hypothetical protein